MNRASDKRRSLRALDLLAFLVPDAQTGVGPFLVVFMSSALQWNADRVADPDTVVALQLLDGIGAGVFAVMQLLMVADITRGSGNFNLGQGIVATAVGIGAALSNLLAGAVVNRAGYASGFSVLGSIAMIALLLFVTTMPETRRTMSNPLLSSRAAH